MGFLRRHRVVASLLVLSVAAIAVVGTTAIAVWRAAHTDDARRIDHVDAIIVLGAAEYGGEPSPVFRGRLDHAVLLWDQDRADVVIVVGGKLAGDPTTEADAGRDYLIGQGLPAEVVVASPVGNTTYESLRGAAEWMLDRDLRTAFLVSDPWHNLRVKRMTRDLGIEGYASATWTSAARTEGTRSTGYVRETFAYLYYRLFGG